MTHAQWGGEKFNERADGMAADDPRSHHQAHSIWIATISNGNTFLSSPGGMGKNAPAIRDQMDDVIVELNGCCGNDNSESETSKDLEDWVPVALPIPRSLGGTQILRMRLAPISTSKIKIAQKFTLRMALIQ